MVFLKRNKLKFKTPSTPPDLLGNWKPITQTDRYSPVHLANSGESFIYSAPQIYQLTSTKLTWFGIVFDRISGNSSSIVGVWRDPITLEEMTLRADFSYLWYVPPENGFPAESYTGFYKVQTNTLQTFEKRGTFTANSGQITFIYPEGNIFTFDFVITLPKLTLTLITTGEVIVYLKD